MGSWRAASARESQHGPLCKDSTACFVDDGTSETWAVDPREASGDSDGTGSGASPPPDDKQDTHRRGRLPLRTWHEMTTEDFRAMKEAGTGTIAILPVSAIEQHGPHLPCSVDMHINQGILERALQLADPSLPVTVLPMQPIGKSDEHIAFPGTLTLSVETLTSMWLDIGESVHRAGVRKMVIFNSHGGQPQVMDIVARELRVRHGMLVVVLSWFGFGLPRGVVSAHEQLHGIHGGEIETSMMMHLQPHLVRIHLAQNFEPTSVELAQRFDHLLPEGGVGFGWMSHDLHPSGAMGNASAATREKGEVLVEHAAEKLAELLAEVDAFPLSFMRPTSEAGGWSASGMAESERSEGAAELSGGVEAGT